MAERDALLKQVYDASGDTTKLSASYDRWADTYDVDLAIMGYRYPFMVAGTLGRFVPDLDSQILDAGCGSGVVGEAISLVGYRNLTGIDLSTGMLEKARAKGFYNSLKQQELGKALDFADASFDTVVSAGVMTPGHAPPECLVELTRIVKSGGHLVVTIAREAWEGAYRDVAQRLAADRVVTPLYSTNYFVVLPGAPPEEQIDSRVFVMRKL